MLINFYTICHPLNRLRVCVALFGLTTIVVRGQTNYINYQAIGKIKIHNEAQINTSNLESSPAFVGDKIGYIFTGVKNKFFDSQIDEPYFDLGLTSVELDNTLSNNKTFYKRINSDLHEGAMSYDINSNTLYFTRSHTERALSRKTDTTYLRIMTADLNKANPTVDPMPINVEKYSVCHPTLSKDGRSMIFSSNKPGTLGKMDLHMAYFDGQTWTGVVNLSSSINGSSNEIFPTLVSDSILIFASDRDKGFGGLDMYCSLLQNGEWSQPTILPKPINSAFDDFGLIARDDFRSGYFTSTRLGGRGKDDIYSWQTDEPIFGLASEHPQPVVIHILDKLTLETIANPTITVSPLDININDYALSSFNVDMLSGKPGEEMILKIKPKSTQHQKKYTGNASGDLNIEVLSTKKYLLQIEADGYNPASLVYDYGVFSNDLNMVMEPSSAIFEPDMIHPEDTMTVKPKVAKSTAVPGIDVDEEGRYTFKNLYFDYNSHTLKEGATSELDALVTYLSTQPNATLHLESHTDSRGTSAYNLQLSIRRAESARDYIVSKGINADLITIRGYGETHLLNDCRDNKPCKESAHRINRRIECQIKR
jgi:outer membrane protein OmpA-like peptidoglycan-associated protein